MPLSRVLSLLLDRLATPIGEMVIVADREGSLRATFWTENDEDVRQFVQRQYLSFQVELGPAANPLGLTAALAAYFAGDLHAIDALPAETAGTAFQREVWQALRGIPCGTTFPMGNWRGASGGRRRFGRWAQPTAPIPSEWWCRVIG
jgi:methylated-DNA-[protein]-cysteine S-methyltransferase